MNEAFVADVSDYLVGIQEMIDKTVEAAESVANLRREIEELPRETIVTVKYVRETVGEAPEDIQRTVTDVTDVTGGASDDIQKAGEQAQQAREDFEDMSESAGEASERLEELSDEAAGLDEHLDEVRENVGDLKENLEDAGNAMENAARDTRDYDAANREAMESARQLGERTLEGKEGMDEFIDALDEAVPGLKQFMTESAIAGESLKDLGEDADLATIAADAFDRAVTDGDLTIAQTTALLRAALAAYKELGDATSVAAVGQYALNESMDATDMKATEQASLLQIVTTAQRNYASMTKDLVVAEQAEEAALAATEEELNANAVSTLEMADAQTFANANVIATMNSERKYAETISMVQEIQEREQEQLIELSIAYEAEAAAAREAAAATEEQRAQSERLDAEILIEEEAMNRLRESTGGATVAFDQFQTAIEDLHANTDGVTTDMDALAEALARQDAGANAARGAYAALADGFDSAAEALTSYRQGMTMTTEQVHVLNILLSSLATGGLPAFNEALRANTESFDDLDVGMRGAVASSDAYLAGMETVSATQQKLTENTIFANEALAMAGVEAMKLSATEATLAGDTETVASVMAAAREAVAQFTTTSHASAEDVANLAAVTLALTNTITASGGAYRGWGAGLSSASVVAAGGLLDMVEAAKQASAETGVTGANMLAMAAAARQAGDNIGGMTIPLGAAAFGITGIGTALHLVFMAVVELLATLVPAMIAAAAGASVLVQGFSQLKTQLTSVYEVGESLGPAFGKTQGDMLGLGHSLQVAQNAADPDAYELLGEAIIGVDGATGHLNDQMGSVTHTSQAAGQGISSFGQMGLAVGSELEKFGAGIDADLNSNLKTVTSLLANAVPDLVEWGQVMGNLGHAVLNLAADMPGLAEIILKVIDGITQLVKWVSELNPTLIAVVFGFEEAYRWSGLLVGIFGLLARAIALVGTLGLPVIGKIGMNMGAMAANVITGVGDMIVNFTALLEKMGLLAAGVKDVSEAMDMESEAAAMSGAMTTLDAGATTLVGGLGKAAAFMSGPWGAAVMLAVAALTVLTIWIVNTKNATQQWVEASQKAVSSATNLTVLNVIGQQLADTTQKLAQTNDAWNASQQRGLLSAAESVTSTKALTQNQQQLFNESNNVVAGAESISQTYGVSFSAALGIADLAGVKLATTQVTLGVNANKAGIQIESLIQGFDSLGQSGNTLANSMNAINVEAGIQSSQISKVNTAWDQFISMATSLTSGFSQLNLDLEQMGNVAAVTGSKITAFSTSATAGITLSVSQIAASLNTFSGSSAQTWQAFDQSITGANTFIDSLRTGMTAGVVTSGDYTKGVADIVAELIPYAAQSKTAAAEVSALAQEAGGPATDSISALKSWVDKAGGSTSNMSGLVDTLTQKLTNVTSVAKTFADTLQQDVINAIASAGVNTSNITGLTEAYTKSLQENGSQSGVTKSAQDQLTKTLQSYGFSASDIKELEQELTQAYGNNASQAGTTKGKTDSLRGSITEAGNQATIVGNGGMRILSDGAQSVNKQAGAAESTLRQWPSHEATTFHMSGTGGANISASVGGFSIPGGGGVRITPMSAGGVLPGYDPGHDSIHALLSPGEGILVPQAVRALGGEQGITSINKSVRHFAGGGVAFPDVTGQSAGMAQAAATDMTDALGHAAANAVTYIQHHLQQELTAAAGTVTGHLSASESAVASLMTVMAAAQGWTGAQLQALLAVESREAGFNPNAKNPSSGAYGLAQFIDGPSEYAQYGGNANTVAGQITGMLAYIKSRYGNPEGALAHEVSAGWYDQGGMLAPGWTLALNNTGQPERVTAPNGSGPGEGGMVHAIFQIDGKSVFEGVQPYALQWNSRNRGNGNMGAAGFAPNRGA